MTGEVTVDAWPRQQGNVRSQGIQTDLLLVIEAVCHTRERIMSGSNFSGPIRGALYSAIGAALRPCTLIGLPQMPIQTEHVLVARIAESDTQEWVARAGTSCRA